MSSNLAKKSPSSVTTQGRTASSTPWSHVYVLMKSGEFSQSSSLYRTLARGVEFMVRRLVGIADPASEAIHCIDLVETQIKCGKIADPTEIPAAIRTHILARNPGRATKAVRIDSDVVPTAIARAVKAMTDVERAAASMYYVESLGERVICDRLSITAASLQQTLTRLRLLARPSGAPANAVGSHATNIAV